MTAESVVTDSKFFHLISLPV